MKNGKKQNRSGRPGYQGTWLIGALVCLTVVGDCSAAEGMFEGMFNKLGLSGAAKMSDVAVKIAEIKDSINVNGLDFSPDGKHLATSSYAQSNEVHVWDWQARKVILKLNREGSAGLISEGIRYSPDGRFLAVGHGLGVKSDVIHVFDARTGQLVKEINDPIPGGGANAIGFTPDGEWMLRITRRGPIRGDNLIVYSTRTWEPSWGVVTKPFAPNAMSISPNGKMLAIGGMDIGPDIPDQPRILIVDLQQRQVVKSIATFPIDNAIERVAWSPDGAQIAAGASVGGSYIGPDIVKIFDAETGQQILGEPVVNLGGIAILRYSNNGKYLAEGQIDDKIRIWDGQHKTLLQEIPIKSYGINLVFSKDSRFMAIANGSRQIQVWQMK